MTKEIERRKLGDRVAYNVSVHMHIAGPALNLDWIKVKFVQFFFTSNGMTFQEMTDSPEVFVSESAWPVASILSRLQRNLI